jgi:hypothetical protein
MYDINSVDAAVASLSAIVQDAMEQTIPRGFITKSKFPNRFYSSSRYYITKKNYFCRCFKKKIIHFPFIVNYLRLQQRLRDLDGWSLLMLI